MFALCLYVFFLAGPFLCDGINDFSDGSRLELLTLGVQRAGAIYQISFAVC